MTTKKVPTVHHDLFGMEITVGSYVVSYGHNSLDMFVVEKLNPKMVGVKRVKSGRKSVLRYPKDLVIVEDTKAVFKLLST